MSTRLSSEQKERNKRATDGKPSAQGVEWRHLEEKMREALRLRQRSMSTEKTYLSWLRSFGGWIGDKEPDGLQGRELQDFLSHLAVEKKIAPSKRFPPSSMQ